MLGVLAVVVGITLVAALADLLNTLVTMQTSQARWWLTGMIETHTSLPMLMLFRSHHRAPYRMLRRSIRFFRMLTEDADLSEYRARFDGVDASDQEHRWTDLHAELEAHGFELLPIEVARQRTLQVRRPFDAPLEFLIDELMAPRGFWGHDVALECEHASLPAIRPDRSE